MTNSEIGGWVLLGVVIIEVLLLQWAMHIIDKLKKRIKELEAQNEAQNTNQTH